MDKENIYIISKLAQKEAVERQKLSPPTGNLLYEPTGKNTLPCIGLAALFIGQKDPDGIVVVSPADHRIDNQPLFQKTIRIASGIAASHNGIVTIGIPPTHPATGYGYIQTAGRVETGTSIKAFKVKRFVEKPKFEVAGQYCSSGEYFWNSGIFVFKCSVLWDAIRKFAPDIYDSLMEIGDHMLTPEFDEVLNRVYNAIQSISIDYAILEKADNVYLVKGDFVWNDLGSWEQVYEQSEKDAFNNATVGQVLLEDTENSYVYSSQGLIAVMGLKDILVVQDGNATLVCKRERGEDIKKLVERLRSLELTKYV